jgi:hypothetical protein
VQQEDNEKRGEKTRWRRDKRTRGQRNDRRLNNQLAQQEDKRASCCGGVIMKQIKFR